MGAPDAALTYPTASSHSGILYVPVSTSRSMSELAFYPSFDIVIPSRERPELLWRCLESLRCLDYPSGQWRAIVVNDGSSQPYDDIIGAFAEQIRLEYI